MRNLLVQQQRLGCVPLELNGAERESITKFCINSADGLLYVATSAASVLCLSHEGTKVEWRASLLPQDEDGSTDGAEALQQQPAAGVPHIVGFTFVLELDAVSIGLSSGELLLLYTEQREIEEVGAVAGGIAALAWSPDGELVVVVSSTGNLLLMNKEWTLLAEVPLEPLREETATAAAASTGTYDVTISWRGDGKFFATSSADPRDRSQRKLLMWDRDGCVLHATAEAAPGMVPALCWQPNGRHLYTAQAAAAPAPQEQPRGRRQRVPVPPQQAHATATRDSSVTDPSATQPSTSAAASEGSSKPLVHKVLLYERNGLQHGGFEVPCSSGGAIQSLSWSSDSELLAVVLGPAPGGAAPTWEQQPWSVQVWHRSNWHWYLKQELRFPTAGTGGIQVAWDDRHAARLHVMCASGTYHMVHYFWQACVSAKGTAVVVDGRQLLITPLRHSVVPPPMCAVSARCSHPVCHVAIFDDGEQELIAAVMANGRMALLSSVEEDLWEETLEEQADAGGASDALQCSEPELPIPLAEGRPIKAVAWLGPGRLLVVASPFAEAGMEQGKGDVLVEVSVTHSLWGDDPTPPSLHEVGTSYAHGTVLRAITAPASGPLIAHGASILGSSTSSGTGGSRSSGSMTPRAHPRGAVLLQLSDGTVTRYSQGGGQLPAGSSADFPAPCPVMLAAPATPAAPGQPTKPPGLGLAATGQLYWGNTLLESDVTSVAVCAGGPAGAALLYTTRDSLLHTVLWSQVASGQGATAAAAAVQRPQAQRKKGDAPQNGELRTAMREAMKPHAAAAAARGVAVRAVEQGARLVVAPEGGVNVVLQMPRGNLEVVAPRLLVLAAVAAALRHRRYGEAWALATANRVDLNLMVDVGWPGFLSDAAAFVQAVPSASDICDLLHSLRPGSVLEPGGLYDSLPAALPSIASTSSSSTTAPGAGAAAGSMAAGAAVVAGQTAESVSGSKVAAVCAAVREAVEGLESPEYLKVVVTSFARSDPPDLASALLRIRDAKEAALASPATANGTSHGTIAPSASSTIASSAPSTSTASTTSTATAIATDAAPGISPGAQIAATGAGSAADAALRHLLLHVDADVLYKEALGLYCLPLAFMVIGQAQRDPGEYLIELQAFAAIKDEHLRCAGIDRHLRRFDRALSHLVAAGPDHFDAALKLALDQGLMRQMLLLHENTPQLLPRVLEAHGQVLLGQKRPEDAAVAFMAAGCGERALHAYKDAGAWHMVFVMAARLGYTEAATQQLAHDVADSLVALGAQADAGQVLLQYLGDVDGGVAAMTAGGAWREALRVSYAHNRQDLVDTVVAPAAADAAASLLSEATESTQRIGKYAGRLAEVRARRVALAAALAAADAEAAESGGFGGAGALADDAPSEAPSEVSGMSAYTNRTHTATVSMVGGGGGSTRAPSTVGGRKAQKPKKGAKAGRIRQGSPGEEAALCEHLAGLAPRAGALQEAGQLCELLCMLGHVQDARTLQRRVAAWQAAHAEAAAAVRAWAEQQGEQQLGPAHQQPQQQEKLAAQAAGAEVRWKWDILRQ